MSYDTTANHQSAQPNKPLSIFGGFKKKVEAPKQVEPPKKSMYDFDDDPPAKKIKQVDKKTNDMEIRYQKNIESAKKQIKEGKELKKSEQMNKPKYGPTIVDTSSLFGKKEKKDEEKKDLKIKNKNEQKNKEMEAEREKEKRKEREKEKEKEMEREKERERERERERENRNKERQREEEEKRVREKERKKRLEETERQDRAKEEKERENKNKEMKDRKTEKRERSREKKKKTESSSSSSSSRNEDSEDESENEKAFKMLRGIDFMKKHYDKADIYRKRDRERIVESGVGEMMREDRHTYRIAEEDERRERERERREIERRNERKKSRHQ